MIEPMRARQGRLPRTRSDRVQHPTYRTNEQRTTFREAINQSVTDGFLSTTQLREIIHDKQFELKKFGYQDLDVVEAGAIYSYSGTLYAAVVRGTRHETGEQVSGWITANMLPDSRRVEYHLSLGDVVIGVTDIPDDFEMAWLQEHSENTKVVKSRPPFLYPELFHLPVEEVWPPNSKIAVIGDPYQSCDKEGVTIIDYEYADEMVPPVLRQITLEREDLDDCVAWYKSVYHEDLNALDRIYGPYTPYLYNPYQEFMNVAFEQCHRILADAYHGNYYSAEVAKKIQELRILSQHLIDGSWTITEVSGALGIEPQYLQQWHEWKQESVDGMAAPERWDEYQERWKSYIDNLPVDFLRERFSDYDRFINRLRHWLEVLPASTSPQRISRGVNEMMDIYYRFQAYYDVDNEETHELYDHRIVDATARDLDGALGFFQPGHTLSLRTKKILEEAIYRLEQADHYAQELYPRLVAERDRLRELGVSLSSESELSYLGELEQAWRRQHFFKKRTQRAVPIHGYFPWKIPGIDEQDRILDLTGNSMHGWNYMTEQGFENFFNAALPYVAIGGKYILGPINQYVYFHGASEGFNAEGLSRTLRTMSEHGLISYRFIKGKREYQNYYDSYVPEDLQWDEDDQVLHDNESAHSLIITRLR